MIKKIIISTLVILIFNIIHSLTLEEAIIIGLENSPSIRATNESLNSAKWDYYQSNIDLFPTASINGTMLRYDPSITNTIGKDLEDATSYGFQANMPLFVGGKVWQNSRIKKNIYEINKYNYNIARLTLISEIENKFFTVLENRKIYDISEKEYENAILLEEITDVRYQNGSLVEAELHRMKSLTGQRKVKMVQSHTNYLTSILDLKSTLGTDIDIEIDDISDPNSSNENFDIENWNIKQIEIFLQRISLLSLGENLSIKMSEKSIDSSKRILTTEGGNFLPSINLSYRNEWQKNNLQDEYQESGNIALSASMPIFPIINNVANYIKNKSTLRQSEYEHINTKNSISIAIRSAALNWISAVQTLESAKNSLHYAEQSWESMKQRYLNGIITNTDMLDADIMLSNSTLQFTNSKFNILRSKAILKQLLNIESDDVLYKMITDIIQE